MIHTNLTVRLLIVYFAGNLQTIYLDIFEVAMKNSAWNFTVWDKEELVGMVRMVSDQMMVAYIHDLFC